MANKQEVLKGVGQWGGAGLAAVFALRSALESNHEHGFDFDGNEIGFIISALVSFFAFRWQPNQSKA